VQLFKPYFNQETVDKAHAHGIKCNVFFADEIDEAKKYIEMGIDTILTNDYLKISSALKIK
jgi:glycerophosphoryl diester phosphodiesterase